MQGYECDNQCHVQHLEETVNNLVIIPQLAGVYTHTHTHTHIHIRNNNFIALK